LHGSTSVKKLRKSSDIDKTDKQKFTFEFRDATGPKCGVKPSYIIYIKTKPEVEFQYCGRLFLETGSSNISAVD